MVQPQDVLPSLPGVSKQAVGVHSRNEIRPNCNARYSCDRMDQVRLNRVEDPHVLTCARLVHFTENENAKEIGQLETLVRGFCFKAPNWYGKFNLNWWAAIGKQQLWTTYQTSIQIMKSEVLHLSMVNLCVVLLDLSFPLAIYWNVMLAVGVKVKRNWN